MIRISAHQRPDRGAFTLTELMIVIAIIVTLLGITVGGVNYARSSDRVSGAARQVQSFLSGARSRAMHSNEPRGVRFFIEQNLGGSAAALRTVTTMAYIAPGGTWAAPKDSRRIQLERIDGNGDGDFQDAVDTVSIIRGFNNPGWWNLKRRGLLVDGMRIRIPADTGDWYPITVGTDTTNPSLDVTSPPPDVQFLFLQVPFADEGEKGQQIALREQTYEIELPTRVLPEAPAILPDGVVIDLDGSQVPSSWRPTAATGGVYSGFMDIMFSPRGNVIGDSAGTGLMHFYVCDSEDALFLKEEYGFAGVETLVASGVPFIPIEELNGEFGTVGSTDPYLVGDRRIVSMFTRTGVIAINKVEGFTDAAAPAGITDDPYLFAETGETAE